MNAVIYRLLPYSFCKDKGSPSLPYANQQDMDNEDRVADGVVDVGADEITCDDVYNPMDWDADGMVNLNEFRRFSDVWLAHDPNDPAIIDPNNPDHDYVTDPNSPGYIDPNRCEDWSVAYQYNLSTDGNSVYSIDVADLLVFLDDAPWLWVACWRHDIQDYLSQAATMMMATTSSSETSLLNDPTISEQMIDTKSLVVQQFAPLQTQQPVQSSPTPVEVETVEIPIAQQIADLQEAIRFLESIGNDPNTQLEIQVSDWQQFMNEVYNSLTELQEKDIITQEQVEE